MLAKFQQIWKTKELRNNIGFVLAMLVCFRLLAHIPIPGVDTDALRDFFASNEILGLVNVFSGGTMERFSVVALGVGPYITASIIFQLLAMIIPSLEEMQRDGAGGQERINQYTRLATVPLAFLQAFGMLTLLTTSGFGIMTSDPTLFQKLMIVITMTTGTVFLMWIGELISERKIGNGISILIFAGIISQMPTSLQQLIVTFEPTQILNVVIVTLLAIVTVAGIVFITEGQRNIPIVYAKRMRGAKVFGGVETHLPLRVNMAGVIPIIFAISIILFPPMIAQFFINAKTQFVADAARKTIEIFQDQFIYGLLYFIFVFGFTYFYTAVVFHPDRVAENLQKQGGFIPGVRPGNATAEFISRTVNRIIPAGALFLATIAVLPLVVQNLSGMPSLVVGGAGLLIVVSVVIEIMTQVNAQLTMKEYDML